MNSIDLCGELLRERADKKALIQNVSEHDEFELANFFPTQA